MKRLGTLSLLATLLAVSFNFVLSPQTEAQNCSSNWNWQNRFNKRANRFQQRQLAWQQYANQIQNNSSNLTQLQYWYPTAYQQNPYYSYANNSYLTSSPGLWQSIRNWF
jgi:hypothetical protein